MPGEVENFFYEVYGALNFLLIFPVCIAHSNMFRVTCHVAWQSHCTAARSKWPRAANFDEFLYNGHSRDYK